MDIEVTNVLSRQSLVKLASVAACALPAQVALAGCSSSTGTPGTATGQESEKGDGSAGTSVGKDPASANGSAQAPATADADGAKDKMPRVLVAFFSGTGHTERVAQLAAEQLGTDTFVITPTKPYTSEGLNYNDESSRVCREHDDLDRPVELEVVTPEGFDDYDVVLVGYPIWWQHASWVLDDFVTGNDFTGKDVIPFCTSAASPLGESATDLAELAGTGDWRDGVRFSAGVGEEDVRSWVDGLEL